ncbi:MAG: non-canonical purine NTP pyrophosphatase [Lachnospiraceae bacterium]|nr:non-canonical purine NTP pyrophosphatase [Lachnospiraceae bacterium]
MRTIIFATTNEGKLSEISRIMDGLDIELLTMKQIGFTDDIDENGQTFEDNAAIKAVTVAGFIKENRPEYADAIIMADDSGLEIDAMGKMPGVQSHRWLGERTYEQAMTDIINELEGKPENERTARFVCSVSASGDAVKPIVTDEEVLKYNGAAVVRETVEGMVAHELKGENGFGYDPFFYVPEYGCTTAEMSPDQKNEISHRGKAIRAMRDRLVSAGVLEYKQG